MALKLITAPANEPVSLDEVKEHLRVDGSEEDALIQGMILTARHDVETVGLHMLITQTWDWFLDAWPSRMPFEIPFTPLQSITGIYYTPRGSSEATFASSNYVVDTYSRPGRITLKSTASWPGDELEVMNGVRIRFVCGFGDTEAEVEKEAAGAIAAIKLLIGHYYEHREEVFDGRTAPTRIPGGVHDLLMDLRRRVSKQY